MLTLWNPYTVELNIEEGMEVEFYRFPLEVQFFRENGAGGWRSASSGQFVHLSQMYRQRNNQFTESHMQDKLPYRVRIPEAFVLEPGEYKVFSPSSVVTHYENENFTKGMELAEGFVPGGKGGGVGIIYMAVDLSYQPLCQWPEMTSASAQILLNPGDKFGVAVRAGKINRNASFAETNDKEIVAYLKTYQGDGGRGDRNTSSLDAVTNGLDQNRVQGVVELDLTQSAMQQSLLSYGDPNDMTQFTVDPNEFPVRSILVFRIRLSPLQKTLSDCFLAP